MTTRTSLAALLCLLLAACSSDTSHEEAQGPEVECSEAMLARCLASHQVCVATETSERCEQCPDGQYADADGVCTDFAGTSMRHDFGTQTLEPGEEVNGLCQSWTLGNDAELWVNGVEFKTDGGYHHSNWLFVPEDTFDGPDGAWLCSEREYTELGAAVAGGVLFAQSTQAVRQVQKFQEGVAVHLPARTRIIAGTHLLEVSGEALSTELAMTLYTIPAADVTVPLSPFRLSYLDLRIAPNAISEFSTSCDFSAKVPDGTPGDLDMDLYYVMPHYHYLGNSFDLRVFGGPDDGEVIYSLGAFDGEAHGTLLDPPRSMRGAQGFSFTCGYRNTTSKEVRWGIGDQEMCVMLGFGRSRYAFDATVGTGVEGPEQNGARQWSGECGVTALQLTGTAAQ
jgi:hypothetical protein